MMSLALATLAGCGDGEDRVADGGAAGDATAPVAGGTAVVAIGDEPDVLNALVRTSAVAGSVLSLLQASLAEMGEDLAWKPEVAARWEIAPDSLAITYHLRPWHWEDGEPLTAADVVLSFELLRDPQIGSPRSDLLRPVVRAEALDPRTVRYTFARPLAHPVQTTVHAILPAHVVGDLDRADVANWPVNRRPLASGPWRLADWKPGRQLELVPNPAYPRTRPWLDRVVLRVIPDQTAQILALETGEVDVVAELPAAAARRLSGSERVELHEISGRVFGLVMWNTRRPALASPEVRRALSLAIDRQRICAQPLGGFAAPGSSYLPPALWNHHRDLAPDPHDPVAAAALLAAAGWRDDDGDGVRERGGRPLRLEILYRGGDTTGEDVAAVVRQNLRDVGVAVDLRALELATALTFLREGRFDAYLGEYQANLYADPSPLVASGATDRVNFGGYANARVDSLLAVALAESDRERSRPVWYEIQEELATDPPAAVLYYLRQIVGVDRRLRDVRPHMLSVLNNLGEWWIAPEDRRYAAPPASP
jgi:peptide/nickel transport system substrate-binding protein